MAVWNCEGRLLSGLGISPGHTAYADSQGELDSWAEGHAIGKFTEYSYTRPDSISKNAWAPGACHVAGPYTNYKTVDYIMFRNYDFEPTRWFYGRVMHCEYVNPNSTRLWFVIDYWLSYMDELRDGLGKCFIERSHVKQSDDWDGDNPRYKYLNPEDYVPPIQQHMFKRFNDEATLFDTYLKPDRFILFAAADEKGKVKYEGKKIIGMPTMCYTKVCQNLDELSKLAEEYNKSSPLPFYDTSNPKSIVTVLFVPRVFATDELPSGWGFDTPVINRSDLKRSDGKPFHNAKCLCYPYCSATAKTANGQEIMLKMEEVSEKGTIHHSITPLGGMQPKLKYSTLRYDEGFSKNQMRFITTPEYPQISVPSDEYAQWAAQNGVATAIGVFSASVMIAVGLAGTPFTGGASNTLTAAGAGAIGATASGLSTAAALSNLTLGAALLTDRLNSFNQASHFGDTMVGAIGGMEAYTADAYRVSFYFNHPAEEDLTAVDDYFDAFGYALMRFQKPNLKVRQYFTFVKTSNAQVKAQVPDDGIQFFCNMLNAGCTFWNIGSGEIGADHGGENPDA